MLYIIMLFYVLIVYLYVFAASVYIYRHNTTSKIVIYAKHEMVMSDMRQKCLLQPEMRRQGNNGLQIQTLIWPSSMNLLSLSGLNQNALPLLYLMHDNPQCIIKIYSIYNLVYINNLNIGNFCKVRGLKALNPQKQQKLS